MKAAPAPRAVLRGAAGGEARGVLAGSPRGGPAPRASSASRAARSTDPRERRASASAATAVEAVRSRR